MNLIYFSIYASTGSVETPAFEFLTGVARFFHYFAQICFLFILILCAKGYLTTLVSSTKRSAIEIVLLILLYMHIQLVLVILAAAVSHVSKSSPSPIVFER